MKKILFVDDDPNVLRGLERMLHKMQGEWELHFAGSGKEALALMATVTFDLVVSDMRMPEMSGAQLLNTIKERYPGVMRFILSGHSDHALIMQSVGCTHRFLAKPCDPKILMSAIKNSTELSQLLGSAEVRKKIAAIPSLPTLPSTYIKLHAELESETSSLAAVARIIALDVGMTTKILQLVNSAFFSLPTRVDSPMHAISLLGLDTVKSLVLMNGVFGQFTVTAVEGISLETIYTHSTAVGASARNIARKLGMDKHASEEAFLAGIMHDVGQAIVLAYFPDQLKAALQLARQRNIPLHLVERETIGATHAEIGAFLLSLWGQSDPIVEAVAYHHQPAWFETAPLCPLTAVHLADALSATAEGGDMEQWRSRPLDEAYIRAVGVMDLLPELERLCHTAAATQNMNE